MKKTTIQIEISTRERLVSVGAKAETYDGVINRALDALDKKK
jgi:hypothetical protein